MLRRARSSLTVRSYGKMPRSDSACASARSTTMAVMTAEQYDVCVQQIIAADLHLSALESHLHTIQNRRWSEAFTLARIALTVLMERLAVEATLSLETEDQDMRGDPEEAMAFQRREGPRPGLRGH